MFRTRRSRAQRAQPCWTSSPRCARTGPTSNAPNLRRGTGPEPSRQKRRVVAEAQASLLPATGALDADPRRGEYAPPWRAVIDHVEIGRLQPDAIQGAVDAQCARDQPGTTAPS